MWCNLLQCKQLTNLITYLNNTTMDKPIYGNTYKGVHSDTSKTLQGAKSYATRNGYKFVSVRYGYNAFIIAIKQNNKWIDINDQPKK